MKHLFRNNAFPRVRDKTEAIASLRGDITRATSIHNSDWHKRSHRISTGITITDNPKLASHFHAPKGTSDKKMTGQKGYLVPFTYEDIKREAEENGIIITDEALLLMVEHTTELRNEFINIQAEILGHDQLETTGRLLFAPKGAIGRAPIMHVDDVYLTLHETFAGANARILTGMQPTDAIWDMMDRRKTAKIETENGDSLTKNLLAATTNYNDEFSNTPTNDPVIMKGQRDRNLSDHAQRNQVCIHSSSQMIQPLGQVAATFFTRPLQSNDL